MPHSEPTFLDVLDGMMPPLIELIGHPMKRLLTVTAGWLSQSDTSHGEEGPKFSDISSSSDAKQ